MKILISGFPHSGTTILRKIIGNHEDIIDIDIELDERNVNKVYSSINKPININTLVNQTNKHIVVKHPNFNLFGNDLSQIKNKTQNYDKIILIIKNYKDIFTSLCLRYFGTITIDKLDNLTQGRHQMDFKGWEQYAKLFLEAQKDDKFLCIKYEDLFIDNYQKIKDIFNWLNIEYNENVLNLKKNQYHNSKTKSYKIMDKKPTREDHSHFRGWQINQPLQNMSGKNRHLLSQDIINTINKSKYIQSLNYNNN